MAPTNPLKTLGRHAYQRDLGIEMAQKFHLPSILSFCFWTVSQILISAGFFFFGCPTKANMQGQKAATATATSTFILKIFSHPITSKYFLISSLQNKTHTKERKKNNEAFFSQAFCQTLYRHSSSFTWFMRFLATTLRPISSPMGLKALTDFLSGLGPIFPLSFKHKWPTSFN